MTSTRTVLRSTLALLVVVSAATVGAAHPQGTTPTSGRDSASDSSTTAIATAWMGGSGSVLDW